MGNKWSPGCACSCDGCANCAEANAFFGYNTITTTGLPGSQSLTSGAESYAECALSGPAPTSTYTFPGFSGTTTTWDDADCGGDVGYEQTEAAGIVIDFWIGTQNAAPGCLAKGLLINDVLTQEYPVLWTTNYTADCNSGTPEYDFTVNASYYYLGYQVFSPGDAATQLGFSTGSYGSWSWLTTSSTSGGNTYYTYTGTYSSGGITYTHVVQDIFFGNSYAACKISISATTSSATAITIPPVTAWDPMGLLIGTSTLS
jgi:hypothetical protein